MHKPVIYIFSLTEPPRRRICHLSWETGSPPELPQEPKEGSTRISPRKDSVPRRIPQKRKEPHESDDSVMEVSQSNVSSAPEVDASMLSQRSQDTDSRIRPIEKFPGVVKVRKMTIPETMRLDEAKALPQKEQIKLLLESQCK